MDKPKWILDEPHDIWAGSYCIHKERLGRLERVKAHWRGDPALGVKRGDYHVTT